MVMTQFSPIINKICNQYKKGLILRYISLHGSLRFGSDIPRIRQFKKYTKLNLTKTHLWGNTLSNVKFSSHADVDIPELHGKEFFTYLKQKKHVFAFFYDPACPHCKIAEPEFIKAARETDVPSVKIDGVENEWLCKTLKIVAFPTIRYFSANNSKISWSNFSDKTEKTNLLNFLANETKSSGITTQLLTIVSKRKYTTESKPEKNKLLHLTTSNVCDLLYGKNVLVLFYNGSCNKCDDIIHVFIEAASRVDQTEGQLAICNAEQNSAIAKRFVVNKIPSIKYFKNGRYLSDFQERPTLDNVLNYLKNMKMKLFPSKLTQTEKKSLWLGINGVENIVHITTNNLEESLKTYPSLLIFFYACWSRSCINLKEVYGQAAKKLDVRYGRLAACDAEENTEVADQLLVSHFPTFKYFRNGQYLTDYEGDRSEKNILQFMEEPGKLGFVKVENKIKPSYSVLSLTGNIPRYWLDVLGAESLIFVTDYNFKSLLQNYKTLLVMFYVPCKNSNSDVIYKINGFLARCKACSLMKKEYGKAAFSMPLEWGAGIAACDAEENNFVADKFLVTKLPTIKIFKNGVFVENYVGRRKEHDFLRFVKEVSMRDISELKSHTVKNHNALIPNIGSMLVFWNDVEGGHDVVLMNESNFHRFLQQQGAMLVMFYNPEGDNMENIRREFGLAAKNLPRSLGILAAYECKDIDPVCKTYDISVQDLPIFKYFQCGKFKMDFTGVRSAGSFLAFMNCNSTEMAKQV